MRALERFSFGVGDRFGHQAGAQLQAFQLLEKKGVTVVPVWNKSNREHSFIGSEPQSVFDAARKAVLDANWKHPWHVDADHIRLDTVDRFLPCSDFFTIDVADSIGQPADPNQLRRFIDRHPELREKISLPGLSAPFQLSSGSLETYAAKYLRAAAEAGKIYRHIAIAKKEGFIAEVSMDETDAPQTPPELLVILAALSDEGVQAQTIAPKFTGRFNKGVDYVGDLKQFDKEFRDDLAVIEFAIARYQLPKNLKLSVHSGSDKFSLYPVLRGILQETGKGIHLKTAGTTWLEELIGLAEAEGEGLKLVQEIYAQAFGQMDQLAAPYASVIDIDRSRLPLPASFQRWSGVQVAEAIRHVPGHALFNPHLRQLLHVAFKLAAKAGQRYTDLLVEHRAVVGRNVVDNIFDRHLRPLFLEPETVMRTATGGGSR